MKVLITGFDPFGGETINPAWEAVSRLPDRIGDIDVAKLQVPTIFGQSVRLVMQAVLAEKPDAVICVGQAGGRPAITPERVAVNCMDAPIADNAGYVPQDVPVIPGGPDGYFSTLPIKPMVMAIRAEGLPAGLSDTAGTFVCNQLMYGVLHGIRSLQLPIRAGFIHVPFADVQVAGRTRADGSSWPSLSIDDMVRGLSAAITALNS